MNDCKTQQSYESKHYFIIRKYFYKVEDSCSEISYYDKLSLAEDRVEFLKNKVPKYFPSYKISIVKTLYKAELSVTERPNDKKVYFRDQPYEDMAALINTLTYKYDEYPDIEWEKTDNPDTVIYTITVNRSKEETRKESPADKLEHMVDDLLPSIYELHKNMQSELLTYNPMSEEKVIIEKLVGFIIVFQHTHIKSQFLKDWCHKASILYPENIEAILKDLAILDVYNIVLNTALSEEYAKALIKYHLEMSMKSDPNSTKVILELTRIKILNDRINYSQC